jgi:hypothetical protein
METNLELRRCGWLVEKIANMGENRVPMKLLAAFCHGKSRRQGESKATIRHGYVDTLRKLALGFGSKSNDLSEWMPAARKSTLWAQIVRRTVAALT